MLNDRESDVDPAEYDSLFRCVEIVSSIEISPLNKADMEAIEMHNKI